MRMISRTYSIQLILLVTFNTLSIESYDRAEPIISFQDENTKNNEEGQKNPRGTYKTKEQIQKAPTEDHPCNLTRTSIKISFPALKSETFVNLLGYKEPNLVYLWRCRGVCGGQSSPVACVATRTVKRTIKMMFKTHLTKQVPYTPLKT